MRGEIGNSEVIIKLQLFTLNCLWNEDLSKNKKIDILITNFFLFLFFCFFFHFSNS